MKKIIKVHRKFIFLLTKRLKMCILNMLLQKDRGAKSKSNREISRIETAKGLFAEVIKTDGVFIRWFAGEYFADCRNCGALSVFHKR